MPPEVIVNPKSVARQPRVLLYRVDNTVCVCRDRTTPLAAGEYDLVLPHMQYSHTQHLYGFEARKAGTRVKTTKVRLYGFDARGLNCPWGYIPYIVRTYRAAGYRVGYIDESTPRLRPGCFDIDWEAVFARFRFRVRQEDCFWEMTEAIVQGLGGQIEAPPGFGKSQLIVPLGLSYRKARIVVCAQSKDVVEKTVQDLSRYLPNIGKISSGGKHRKERITVVTAGSLHHVSREEVDIFVGDESHELVAPSYINPIVEATTYARPFGMSATPEGRSDGAEARLEPLFGPPIFAMKWLEAERLGLVVPIRVCWGECVFDANPAAGIEDKTAMFRRGIWRHNARNRAIAEVARDVPDDEQFLILVDKIEHAVFLQQELPEFTLCYGKMTDENFGRYSAADMLGADFQPMDDRRRNRLRNDFMQGQLRKVIATSVWRRAVSFDALQHLFWAAGGSAYVSAYQGPGRVSRINPGTDKGVGYVYDLTDDFDDRLHAQAMVRFKHYKKIGWTQTLPHPQIVERADR